MSAWKCSQERLFWIVGYSPLYEKGMKQNQNSPMENTVPLTCCRSSDERTIVNECCLLKKVLTMNNIFRSRPLNLSEMQNWDTRGLSQRHVLNCQTTERKTSSVVDHWQLKQKSFIKGTVKLIFKHQKSYQRHTLLVKKFSFIYQSF